MGGELTPAQAAALTTLAPMLGDEFYLGEGVAVALRLRHRTSRDLDLFAPDRDPVEMEESLSRLPNVEVTDRAPGTLHLVVGGVPVSLLRYRYAMLGEPEPDARVPVKVAPVSDLICMKLSAIAGRGALRDFWDLHGLLEATGMALDRALELFARKFPRVDRGHVIRALAYFADADAEPMPAELSAAHWARIKSDFQDGCEHWGLESTENRAAQRAPEPTRPCRLARDLILSLCPVVASISAGDG